jgi:hypothetical protein
MTSRRFHLLSTRVSNSMRRPWHRQTLGSRRSKVDGETCNAINTAAITGGRLALHTAGPSEPFPSLLPSRRSTGVLQRRAIRVRRAPRLLLLGGRVFRLAGGDDGAWYSGDRPRFCHDREHSISTVDRVRATVRSGQRTGDDGHSSPCESAFCEWSFTC